MYETQTPFVLDNGSGVCKIGFAGNDAPKSAFLSVVGKPRIPGVIIGTEQKDCYIGEDAQQRRGVLNMTYPIEHGIITNYDDIEKLWTHAFLNELRQTTDDRSVFMTEASLNPSKNREKMTQIMFEKFSINYFYVGNQSVLSLYSIGKVSGLVLSSGDGVTHADPIFEGSSIPHAIQRMNLGGRDITNVLSKLLFNSGTSLLSSSEKQIVRDIKEKHCSMLKGDAQGSEKVQYLLPDDNYLGIGSERFEAPEVMFDSEKFGMEFPGVDQLVFDSVCKVDIDFRNYMLENIILSGGNTYFEGFSERLTDGLNRRIDQAKMINVGAKVKGSPERKFAAWIGASMLSGLNSFQQMWITKSEYEENGPRVIHNKCTS